MSKPEERPYKPEEYDKKIRQTIPFSEEIYDQTISIIERYGIKEGRLLDVGCGAGRFEVLLREHFPKLLITGIDPAEDMLKQARLRQPEGVSYQPGTIMDLEEAASCDIITALMSHHFVKPEDRGAVMAQVFKTLKPGGLYIAFENMLPPDDFLREQELDRWAGYQVAAGKPAKEAEVHKARCGVFYYPLTASQHLELMKNAGFSHIYIFWRSYMQMGIMGIRPLQYNEA